VHMIYFWN